MGMNKKKSSKSLTQFSEVLLIITNMWLAKKPSAIFHIEYGSIFGVGQSVDTPTKIQNGSGNVISKPSKAINGRSLVP
jgi:hypothetical protein